MYRIFLLLGVVLMLVALVALVFLFQGVENPTIATLLESRYCESGETVTQESSITSSSGTLRETTSFYCEDVEGVQRNITNQAILLLAGGGFVLPFITGLLLMIGSLTAITRRRQAQMASSIHFSTINGQMTPEVQKILERVFGTLDNLPANAIITTQNWSHQTSLSLTERLRQLEEARDQGLISADEYTQTRQVILDNFDD